MARVNPTQVMKKRQEQEFFLKAVFSGYCLRFVKCSWGFPIEAEFARKLLAVAISTSEQRWQEINSITLSKNIHLLNFLNQNANNPLLH